MTNDILYILEWVPVLIGGMGLGIGYKREKIKMYNTIYFDTMSGTEVVL